MWLCQRPQFFFYVRFFLFFSHLILRSICTAVLVSSKGFSILHVAFSCCTTTLPYLSPRTLRLLCVSAVIPMGICNISLKWVSLLDYPFRKITKPLTPPFQHWKGGGVGLFEVFQIPTPSIQAFRPASGSSHYSDNTDHCAGLNVEIRQLE